MHVVRIVKTRHAQISKMIQKEQTAQECYESDKLLRLSMNDSRKLLVSQKPFKFKLV